MVANVISPAQIKYGQLLQQLALETNKEEILFTPLALGSYWAIIPALLCIPMNVFRIRSEEEVLLRDLTGYKDYCLKTRYRLLPLVW
jgi:protein-S-isoprenylcysteine O-methyltransferase Ste14